MSLTYGGIRKHSLYVCWRSMWKRCTTPTDIGFHNYGGRGITVCPEWRDFAVFVADMGERPDGYQIERVDNNGPYSKANCVWATLRTQANNKRSNILIKFNGKTQSLKMWSDELGIPYLTLILRRSSGKTADSGLLAPVPTRVKKIRVTKWRLRKH